MQLDSIIEGKRICVTGGSGFIGSNIAQVLAKKNDVIVIDNLLTGHRSNLDNIECKFIEGSVNEVEKLRHAFLGADYVLHQAALPSVPRSVEDPMPSNLNNIEGTLNVLDDGPKMQCKEGCLCLVLIDLRGYANAAEGGDHGTRPTVALRRNQDGGGAVLPSVLEELQAAHGGIAIFQRVRAEAGPQLAIRGGHPEVHPVGEGRKEA